MGEDSNSASTQADAMSYGAEVATMLLSVAAYFLAYKLIGSESVKQSFIKAKLFGKDLNKTSEDKV